MNVHVRPHESLGFANARLILPEGVAELGSLVVAGATIATVEAEATPAGAIDCAGDVLMPGIVDVHTDHFEKHVFPRSHVRWQALPAALAHDAQMIGGGVTTVFDSLGVGSVGTTGTDAQRHAILAPIIEALETGAAAGMFKAEHFIHLRCETADEATIELLMAHLGCERVRIASVMDHTPGVKQSRDIEGYIRRRIAATGWERSLVEAELAETLERLSGIVERVRHEVVALLRDTGLTLMSHDDVTPAHIAEAKADGVTVAEFPTTLEAARAARAEGLAVVAGAPNYVRGGSQSDNVAASDLLAEDLVDILASDYVPRAILDAVFAIAADPAMPHDLAHAVRLATLNPARAAGLADRGAIAPGQRADLLRIGFAGGQPFVRAAWRAGERVA